jgi:hypothetical protein
MRDLPRGTQVANHGDRIAFAYGAVTLSGPPFQVVRLTTGFVTPPGPGRAQMIDSYNPRSETAAAYLADLVWAVPVSLATTKGIISFPPATEMFQFAGLPPPGLCVQPGVTGHDPSRVSPFGHPRINVCSRLPGA